eukprot:6712353-Pyramimonas_sp.AAC.1
MSPTILDCACAIFHTREQAEASSHVAAHCIRGGLAAILGWPPLNPFIYVAVHMSIEAPVELPIVRPCCWFAVSLGVVRTALPLYAIIIHVAAAWTIPIRIFDIVDRVIALLRC